MENSSRHAEWLSLIEVSGPFLSVTVLEKVFPQGLARIETPYFQQLRQSYHAWQGAVDTNDPHLDQLHQLWLQMVLTTLLEYDEESLFTADKWQGTLPTITSQSQQHQFKPDLLVASPVDNQPRLFIALLPPETELTSANQSDGWPLPLHERMTQLCRAHNIRLGLITNGEQWMLVNAPTGSTSSYISWYSRLWFQCGLLVFDPEFSGV